MIQVRYKEILQNLKECKIGKQATFLTNKNELINPMTFLFRVFHVKQPIKCVSFGYSNLPAHRDCFLCEMILYVKGKSLQLFFFDKFINYS